MNIASLLIFLVIGAVAGWLSGIIIKDGGYGMLGNIIIGIVGGIVGGFIFKLLSIVTDGLIGSIVTATVGAVALLYLVNFSKKFEKL